MPEYELTYDDMVYNADWWVGISRANTSDKEMKDWWLNKYNEKEEREEIKRQLEEALPDAKVTEENLNDMADMIEKILFEEYGEPKCWKEKRKITLPKSIKKVSKKLKKPKKPKRTTSKQSIASIRRK